MNVHPSVYEKLKQFKSYRDMHNYLKQFWLTKGERSAIIRHTKSQYNLFSKK